MQLEKIYHCPLVDLQNSDFELSSELEQELQLLCVLCHLSIFVLHVH